MNLCDLASDGKVIGFYDYGPFGEELSDIGIIMPIHFSTRYTDEESALVYYGSRFYNPQIGGWVSRDIIEEIGALNVYGYVNNNSPNYIDVLGFYPELSSYSEAVAHWGGGTGDARFVSITRIDFHRLRSSSLNRLQKLIKQCERDRFSLFRGNSKTDIPRSSGATGPFTVDSSRQPDLFKILGTITIKAFGEFSCQCQSATSKIPWWKFEGEIAAFEDTFNYDWFNVRRDPVRNGETLGARILAGPGKAFQIEIRGTKKFNDDSNK